MVETVEIDGSFKTQLAPVTESAAIANTETIIGVQGKTEASFAAGLVIGDNGSFTITEINSKEFDTEIPVNGISDGEAELFVIAAGQSQENGGFGSNKITTVSDLEAELNSLSSPTQQQLSEKLLSLTVNATASKDGQLFSTVLVQPPNINITSFTEDSSFTTSDEIKVAGLTNVSKIDSTISITFKDGTNTIFTQSLNGWRFGTYEKDIIIENNVDNLPPGTYEIRVSVSGTNVTKSVDIISTSEEKRQNTEERTGEDVDTASNEPDANTEQSSESNSTDTVDDESFTGFTQLDRDVYFQPLEFEVEIGDSYWKIIELKIHRKQYKESGAVDLLAIPDPTENPKAVPKSGDVIRINSGPEQSVADADKRPKETSERELSSGGKLERLFTGTISTVQKKGDGSWKLFAFTHQLDISTTRINVSTGGQIKAEDLFEQVMFKVNKKVDGTNLKATSNNDNVNVNFDSSDSIVYSNRDSFNSPVRSDRVKFPTKKNYTNTVAKEVIKDIELATNSVFWVDKSNTIQFGPPKSKIHKLSFVTESDARVQTPPYKSVKVIGDDLSQVNAETGTSRIALVGDRPTIETQALLQKPSGTYEVVRGELREPTYVYKDESIRTTREARNVATDLLQKINEQRAEGKIIVPGRPMIDIFDVVEVPDSFAVTKNETQLPPAQYLVKEIIHRINESDGFVTEIIVGGLINRYDAPIYKYISKTQGGMPVITRFDPDEIVTPDTRTYLQEQTIEEEEAIQRAGDVRPQEDEEDEESASNTGTGQPTGGT